MNIPFLNQIGRALKTPVFSGYGGRGGFGWQSGLSRGGFDYKSEAGPLWESSIPFMCLAWEKRNTVEAELVVQRRDQNGDWKNEADHTLYELLSNPNPFWDMHDLLDCVRFDYHLSGNAYLWKRRSGSGKVVELYWLPSWCVEPRWPETGLAQIGCYEYRLDGIAWAIPVADVIHFKGILPDPRTHGRKGLSCFAAVLREVCTDNEAAVFTAALLRNMGVPGVIVSPKGTDANPGELTADQRLEFKKLWTESFTGERRGEPFMQSVPVDITMPGFSPQAMLMDKIRSIPETRIAGSFGIPLSVLQLATGLENSNTKAGKGDDREQAIESCVIPTLLGMSRALSRGLVREIENPREVRLWFDLSAMRCLQDDENQAIKTLVSAAGGPIMTPNEARSKRGLKPQPGGDTLRSGGKPSAEKKEKESGSDALKSLELACLEVALKRFDPGEARDDSGKWTSGGGTASKGEGAVKTGLRAATEEERKAHGIPPAWSDVKISIDPESDVIAQGKDKKGRLQVRYSAKYAESQKGAKWGRIEAFHDRRSGIMAKADAEIAAGGKKTHQALTLRLIAKTGLRNGGDEGDGKVKAYGASNLLTSHARVEGDTVHLDFIGKEGVRQRHSFADPVLARHIEARQRDGHEAVFEGDSGKTLAYLKKISDGDFKVHDLRTHYGTVLGHAAAQRILEKEGGPQTERQLASFKLRVAKIVSRDLGNGAAMARDNYIHPNVFGEAEAGLKRD